jgi:hypothetical protein
MLTRLRVASADIGGSALLRHLPASEDNKQKCSR